MTYIFLFLFGLLCGRFFYTLSIQYIDGSFAKDRFNVILAFIECRKCSQHLNPAYLIPLIGYFITKGKCPGCGDKLSGLLPATEFTIGILVLIIYTRLGINIYSILTFLILCISISISIIDHKVLLIPNSLVISIIALSIYPVIFNHSLKNNLYGFLLMSAVFLIILIIFPGSFGGGDLKLAAAIGILLGLELSVVALETALITGSITGAIYAIKSGKGFKIKIPFAPFLTSGLFVSLLYGRDILYIYFRLVY
jgi:leader peptidase (prepilin peptidase) / N-methyltransferase